MKVKIIVTYLVIGLFVALYTWLFGDTAHKSFMYNLGGGFVWPAVMFPSLGKVIGGLILAGFIGYAVLNNRR